MDTQRFGLLSIGSLVPKGQEGLSLSFRWDRIPSVLRVPVMPLAAVYIQDPSRSYRAIHSLGDISSVCVAIVMVDLLV